MAQRIAETVRSNKKRIVKMSRDLKLYKIESKFKKHEWRVHAEEFVRSRISLLTAVLLTGMCTISFQKIKRNVRLMQRFGA